MITETQIALYLRYMLPHMFLFRYPAVLLWPCVLLGVLAEVRFFRREKIAKRLLFGALLAVLFCEILIKLLFRFSWGAALHIYSGVGLVEDCLLSALLGVAASHLVLRRAAHHS